MAFDGQSVSAKLSIEFSLTAGPVNLICNACETWALRHICRPANRKVHSVQLLREKFSDIFEGFR